MKSALGKKVDYNNYHVSEQWQRPQATFMLQVLLAALPLIDACVV